MQLSTDDLKSARFGGVVIMVNFVGFPILVLDFFFTFEMCLLDICKAYAGVIIPEYVLDPRDLGLSFTSWSSSELLVALLVQNSSRLVLVCL